jgi:hypothetical protein
MPQNQLLQFPPGDFLVQYRCSRIALSFCERHLFVSCYQHRTAYLITMLTPTLTLASLVRNMEYRFDTRSRAQQVPKFIAGEGWTLSQRYLTCTRLIRGGYSGVLWFAVATQSSWSLDPEYQGDVGRSSTTTQKLIVTLLNFQLPSELQTPRNQPSYPQCQTHQTYQA